MLELLQFGTIGSWMKHLTSEFHGVSELSLPNPKHQSSGHLLIWPRKLVAPPNIAPHTLLNMIKGEKSGDCKGVLNGEMGWKEENHKELPQGKGI